MKNMCNYFELRDIPCILKRYNIGTSLNRSTYFILYHSIDVNYLDIYNYV